MRGRRQGLSYDPVNKLPEKYSNHEKSGLSATVTTDGENVFNFELDIEVILLSTECHSTLTGTLGHHFLYFPCSCRFLCRFMKKIARTCRGVVLGVLLCC